MKKGINKIIFIFLFVSCFVLTNNISIRANNEVDYIDYISYDQDANTLTWDSWYGPMITISLENFSLVESTGSNTLIIDASRSEDIISVTVYSDEHPMNTIYTFDLNDLDSQIVEHPAISNEDLLEEACYDANNNTLTWDSTRGPRVELSLTDFSIISHSNISENSRVEIVDAKREDNIVTITLYSDEVGGNSTFIFDLNDITSISTPPVYEDVLEEAEYDNLNEVLVWDSSRGPRVELSLTDFSIISHSYINENSRVEIVDAKREGNIVTITLYSDEAGQNSTFVFDLDNITITPGKYVNYNVEEVEWYNVYSDGRIEFDSRRGPLYNIDYINKNILGCTSGGARIEALKVEGNVLKLTVYSDEFPESYSYEFDLTKNLQQSPSDSSCMDGVGEFSGRDKIEYFNILTYENTIEWDSAYGPYYRISLKDGKILECTSDWLYPEQSPAKVIFYGKYNNQITITVYSAELPYEMTYIFDTQSNSCICGISGFEETAAENEGNTIINQVLNGNYKGNGVDNTTIDKIKKAKKENKKIRTKIESNGVKADKVENTVKKLIDTALKNNKLDYLQCLDIQFSIYVEDEFIGNITELSQDIQFELQVDATLDNNNEYYVLRVHEGEVDILPTEQVGDKMKFDTDRFSTYVLVSRSKVNQEVQNPTNSASTEDNNSESIEDVTTAEGTNTESMESENMSTEGTTDESTTTESVSGEVNSAAIDKNDSGKSANKNSHQAIIIIAIGVACAGALTAIIFGFKKNNKNKEAKNRNENEAKTKMN